MQGRGRRRLPMPPVWPGPLGCSWPLLGSTLLGGWGRGRLLGLLALRRVQHIQRVDDEEVETRLRYLYMQRVVTFLLRAQAHVVRRRCERGASEIWQAALERTLLHDHATARASAFSGEPLDPVGQADLAIVDVPVMALHR